MTTSGPVLRIFSYQPNPRVAKATIAARLCGLEVELRGAPIPQLGNWLWDFDARPLRDGEAASLAHLVQAPKKGFTQRLFKTDAFLRAHPFGTVPAAFSPDGRTGIFESNSILRAVARLGSDRVPLYGRDAYAASRIDSFLDASLLFARDSQVYVLALWSGNVGAEIHRNMQQAFETWLGGIERALQTSPYIAGEDLGIADICFAAELTLLHNERAQHAVLERAGLAPLLSADARAQYPAALAHFDVLRTHPAFAPDLGPYLAALGVPAHTE